jgi:hypothetical protein
MFLLIRGDGLIYNTLPDVFQDAVLEAGQRKRSFLIAEKPLS